VSTKTHDPLMEALADLGSLYPDMRFGQLIEMVALLSGEETPLGAEDVEDDRLLGTALDHARVRRPLLETGDGSVQARPSPESRAELLDVLQRLRDRHRAWRLGQLVASLAASSGIKLYDAEDEQLIAAARSLPVG
jgi:hypothetical protein